MRTASATSPNSANLRGAETGIDFSVLGIGLNVNAAITAVLKIKETRKTWGFLCDLLFNTSRIEMTERVAKHRLAGSRDYTVEELQALLHSEEGLDFLVAVMGDAQPAWWRWMTKVMTLAAVRRRQAEDAQEILKLETAADVDVGARRRIKGALNADKRISAAVARAETALGVSRPNLDRVGAAAGGRSSRISHRSMAGASKRQA